MEYRTVLKVLSHMLQMYRPSAFNVKTSLVGLELSSSLAERLLFFFSVHLLLSTSSKGKLNVSYDSVKTAINDHGQTSYTVKTKFGDHSWVMRRILSVYNI